VARGRHHSPPDNPGAQGCRDPAEAGCPRATSSIIINGRACLGARGVSAQAQPRNHSVEQQ